MTKSSGFPVREGPSRRAASRRMEQAFTVSPVPFNYFRAAALQGDREVAGTLLPVFGETHRVTGGQSKALSHPELIFLRFFTQMGHKKELNTSVAYVQASRPCCIAYVVNSYIEPK